MGCTSSSPRSPHFCVLTQYAPLQTSPWYTYFLLSLPKLLNFSYPLAIAAMLIDRRCRRIGYPSLAFVALLSLLKHKEWRFIVYVIPVLNTCAAAGLKSLEQLYVAAPRRHECSWMHELTSACDTVQVQQTSQEDFCLAHHYD